MDKGGISKLEGSFEEIASTHQESKNKNKNVIERLKGKDSVLECLCND